MARRAANKTALDQPTQTQTGSAEVRPSTEAIAQRAFTIYEREGRVDGRDWEHWFKAEAELMAESHEANGLSQSDSPNGHRRASGNNRTAKP